jgi:hypothetical protein
MRIIRAQINWPRTEYSSLILLKDFFNNIGHNRPICPQARYDPLGSNLPVPGRRREGLESGGFRSFVGTRANGEVAP